MQTCDLKECCNPGRRDEHAEDSPSITNSMAEACIESTPGDESRKIGCQNNGECKDSRAEKLSHGLRPDDFVAKRNSACYGVERERSACPTRWRLRCFGLTFRFVNRCSKEAAEGQGNSGCGQVEEGSGEGRSAHTEPRQKNEAARQRADDGAGGVGGVDPPPGLRDLARAGGHGADSYWEGSTHQKGRSADQQEGQGPGKDSGVRLDHDEQFG